MADDNSIDEEGLRRSARSQIIVDTIERSLEKMMFVETNMANEMNSKDFFQIKREAVAAVAELRYALSILTGKVEIRWGPGCCWRWTRQTRNVPFS